MGAGVESKSKAFGDAKIAASASKYSKDWDLLNKDLTDAFVKLQEQGIAENLRAPEAERPEAMDDWGVPIGEASNRRLPGYPESLQEKLWRTGKMQEYLRETKAPRY